MLKIKVTDKNGSIEYFGGQEIIDRLPLMGHGSPEEFTVEITDLTFEYNLNECFKKRRSEYPSGEEFLNAYFDGGQDAIDALQAKRLAIKAKYPKPVEESE